ncbi:MAG TPA: CehA/McbA family metallohydrolase [Acidimicrobiales bacterium]|nr:CehA/McbA family metallohydrolase [Acidimicrobiales bacterium]
MPTAPPAAASRHPHLAAPKPDGWVRVDLHSHTMWSGDATTTPDELAEAVAESGIDVLCITDHGTINGAVELARSGALGCRVVVGEEVRTAAGELIGLFLTERLPFGLKPQDAVAAIRGQGGLVYVPHPFDPMRHCLAEDALEALAGSGGLDAVEAFNAKVSLDHLNRRAAEFATSHGLAAGAGSDAHVAAAVGAAYVEMPDFDDASPASFLRSLRAGRVVGHHYDAPRPWRPRVVPSTKAL